MSAVCGEPDPPVVKDCETARRECSRDIGRCNPKNFRHSRSAAVLTSAFIKLNCVTEVIR